MQHAIKHNSAVISVPRAPRRAGKVPILAPLAWLAIACLFGARGRADAQTCECPDQTPDAALKSASSVFEGRVLPSSGTPDAPAASSNTIAFAVVRSWKGASRERLQASLPEPDSGCAPALEPGQTYLVYAGGTIDAPALIACTRTRPIAEAEEDLRMLGAGVVPVDPVPEGDRPVLPKTMEAPPGAGGCAGCRVGVSSASGALAWPLFLAFVWRFRRRRMRSSAYRQGC